MKKDREILRQYAGGIQADKKPCQHYNMTVNGKCNDCGHVLTDEERQFYERRIQRR